MIDTFDLDREYSKGFTNGQAFMLDEVCKYVNSAEFVEQWNHAKGERFGEFCAKLLKEKFQGKKNA